MLIKRMRGWELPESAATPEQVFLNRRSFLAGAGATAAIAGAGGFSGMNGALAEEIDPTVDLYPAARNEMYDAGRAITEEAYNLTYNNFYEFGSHKKIYKAAQALPIRPWEIKIDGEVEKEFTIGIDDLIRKMTLEERVYRHRCVEAWSMTIPWTGFPMHKLIDLAKPLSSAKYVRMETFYNPKVARGQKGSWDPWPYTEGLTIEEAANELTLLVTGAYGKPAAKQLGAPLRLHVPWKYGFKSIKSIVRFSFTKERPVSFWEELLSNEYGFWANVNPEVPHRRWSQARERVMGDPTYERSWETVPTVIFNGYGEQVAHLYKGLESEALYM